MNQNETAKAGLPATVSREQVSKALDALELDRDSVQQVRIYPDRLRVRYADADGRGAYAWVPVIA